jgi:hypothetical protein
MMLYDNAWTAVWIITFGLGLTINKTVARTLAKNGRLVGQLFQPFLQKNKTSFCK